MPILGCLVMITILLIEKVCVIVFKEWFMQMLTRVHCRLWVESVGWKLCLAVAIWPTTPAVFRFNTHRAGETEGILLCNFNI